MCFRNLPIEVDVHGRAYLREDGRTDPFTLRGDKRELIALERDRALDELVKRNNVHGFELAPVSRVAGTLSFHGIVDFEQRRVLDARAEAGRFRGLELILKHREPSDTVQVASRTCGYCGGSHAVTAAKALEMAYGIAPPPMAVIARNLGESAEFLYAHAMHLFLLAGPDYSETVVSQTTPTLWERAQHTLSPHSDVHGFRTLADIMTALNPQTGELVVEATKITRIAREIATFTSGKYPHPSAIYPGGVGVTPDRETFNQVLGRIHRLIDYAKKVAVVWDDLAEFFYDANSLYRRVGELPANLISAGAWDDPEGYDGSYENCNEWGERRLATPGAMINGELRTTRLSDLNIGFEEFVEHSYYENWTQAPFESDQLGSPLSPLHPWNKETLARPAGRNWEEKYSWSTAPRWDREVMESGPLARQWISAIAGKLKNEFIYSVSDGLEMELPKFERPAMRLHWHLPQRPNALERNRARAYHLAYAGMMAFTFMLKAFEYLQKGQTRMSTPFNVPAEALGVGFSESGQGILTHHLALEGGVIANYQIMTPSTWMASPRDGLGIPGPYEAAVINTPLLEECARPEDFTGIDILRAIRSFDPCLNCTVH